MSDTRRQFRTDSGPKRLSATVVAPQPQSAAETQPSQESRRTRLWATAAAAIAVAALLYSAQERRPTGPSAGRLDVRLLATSVPVTEPARLRIGTYNIHGGKGTDGRRDLSRIAGMLGQLDFVGLNEVHGPGLFERDDQATLLGKQMRMTAFFAPTEERWWHAEFGNALLTKLDVRSWHVVPLERRYGKSFRNLTHVRARAANGAPVNIIVTHIDRSDDLERHEQLRAVGDFFLALQKPAILLGDLNTDSSDPEIQRLLNEPDVVDPLAKKKGFQTPRHIDWILCRGLESADAGISPVGPSDHPHVWAELIVPPSVD